jgi:hypothetical protein
MTTQTRKITLHTAPINGGPFDCAPAGQFELEPERILCNDVRLPGESHPYGLRLWVIGNEYGALGAVWADCEQDALDILVDEGLGDGLLIEEADADEDSARLGNAGEPANLDNAWLRTVVFEPARDWQLLCKFAEARGAAATTLDDI